MRCSMTTSFRKNLIFKMSLTSFLVNNGLNSKVAALGENTQKGYLTVFLQVLVLQ